MFGKQFYTFSGGDGLTSRWSPQRQTRRPWYRRVSQRIGLQSKLMLAFVMLIGLSLGSYCWVLLSKGGITMRNSLAAEARQTAASLAITCAHSFHEGDQREIINVSRELVRSSHNVIFVTFYRADGTPVQSEAQGSGYQPEILQTNNVSVLGTPVFASSGRWNDHITCTSPIFGRAQKGIAGYVKVGISLDAYHEQARAVTHTAARVGAGLLLLVVPVAWLLVRRIFLPIRVLVTATRRIAGGDLDSFVETHRPDVIGELARAFNEMVLTVKSQQEALREANQKLGEANRDLESKVEQRTLQLETANKRLNTEIAEKEDFLRAVSHDLNAPLRNISGMVTMLLMKKKQLLDEDSLHRLDRIKKNVEIETDLINELLELSRIKTRRQAMENVDIEAMVWELRGMFENDLKTRSIDLILDSQLPQLYCERARVRQIFQNLIDNAIKYMGDGPVREIHVGCQIRLSEAEFYVRDTGLGIDADDVGKVFFVFRRGKNTAAQNVAGKGVGLASVKSIIETYNGKIWLESELGKGTAFYFTINGQYVPATGGGAWANRQIDTDPAATQAA